MAKPNVWCILETIMPIRINGQTHLVARLQRTSSHPRLGPPDVTLKDRGGYTQTSQVLRIDAETKIIETLNTRYHYV